MQYRRSFLGSCASLAGGRLLAQTAGRKFPEESADSEAIRLEQYRQLDRYLEGQLAQTDANRARYWSRLEFGSAGAYQKSLEPYRRDWLRYLGVPERLDGPVKARREKVHETPALTAYRVWLEALPGVESYGILLVPKRAGKKAAVIALHGHKGTPEMLAGLLPPEQSSANVYRYFARTLAERGFVVWCPLLIAEYSEEHEPKEGPEARGRDILHKKAMIAGRTAPGVEIAKLQRGVDYLASLPEVDPARIGMYGLSKGGHYTLYTAAAESRIRAAVCSGWFNDRKKKLLAPKDGPGMFFMTYVHRDEYFLPDLLNRFGDAELGWLIAPRAFMVENGDEDRAVLIRDARPEFARVESVYRRLGIADKARYAAFHGPHRIDGAESYPFLDRWLGNKSS